ncbi:tetratricopeptide repeat protein [Saprospiraceae bacterium]|nr:tetratricopeptide repeat protein [Saprospiraceae bacterium]
MEHARRGDRTTLVLSDKIKPEIDFTQPNDVALEFLLIQFDYYFKLNDKATCKKFLFDADKHYNSSANNQLKLWYDIAIIRLDDLHIEDYETEIRSARQRSILLELPEFTVLTDLLLFRSNKKRAVIDSLNYYLDDAMKVAIDNNLEIREADVWRTKGNFARQKADLTKALDYFDRAEKLYNKHHYDLDVANIYTNKGYIYRKRGDFENALETFEKADNIFRGFGGKLHLARVKREIGQIYQSLDNHEEALKEFQEAQGLISKESNPYLFERIKTAFGISYFAMGDINKAEVFLKESISGKEKIMDNYSLSESYCSLGNLYLSTKRIEEARIEFEKAIEISKKIHSDYSTDVAYYGLLQIALNKNDYPKAEKYGQLALLESKNGSIETKFATLISLSKIYTTQKKYKKATEYFKASVGLQDSVMNQRKAIKIASVLEENNNKRKNLEILNLKYQNKEKEAIIKQDQLRSRLYLLLLIFVIFTSLLFAYSYRQNRKASKHQKELNSSLNQSSLKLKESNMQLEQFAHMASHDLKTPIRTITSFSSLLQKKATQKLDNNELEYLDFIINSGKNVSAMIDDILAFSKLGSQKPVLGKTDVDIIIRDLSAIFNSQASEKGIVIQKEDTMPIVMADKVKLKRVFQNIISNAIKFSDSSKDYKFIKIGYQELSDSHQFSISDNGIGISKTDKDLFESFVYLNAKDEYQGTGIGLAICESIITKHGGKIWYESEVGVGTTFYFTLQKL